MNFLIRTECKSLQGLLSKMLLIRQISYKNFLPPKSNYMCYAVYRSAVLVPYMHV